jgi:hypothetical protein
MHLTRIIENKGERMLIGKSIITQVLKKFPVFNGIRRYISNRHSPDPEQQGSSLVDLLLQHLF